MHAQLEVAYALLDKIYVSSGLRLSRSVARQDAASAGVEMDDLYTSFLKIENDRLRFMLQHRESEADELQRQVAVRPCGALCRVCVAHAERLQSLRKRIAVRDISDLRSDSESPPRSVRGSRRMMVRIWLTVLTLTGCAAAGAAARTSRANRV
jgi:hypothetical protein